MKTIDENNGTTETKNECMRTRVRRLCLEALTRMMREEKEVAESICAGADRSIWFVLDPNALVENAEPVEWNFYDLDSCLMLVDERCDGMDPRCVGAIQFELAFGTPSRNSEDEEPACEWTPWWNSLSPHMRSMVAREFGAKPTLPSAQEGACK